MTIAGRSAGSKAPTLLVFADADAIKPEHMFEFYRLLGGGTRDAGLDGKGRVVHQLAVIPGTVPPGASDDDDLHGCPLILSAASIASGLVQQDR